MSNPFAGDPFDQIDDPFVEQLDPFRDALEPFRDQSVMDPLPHGFLDEYRGYMEKLMHSQMISSHEDLLSRQMPELVLPEILQPDILQPLAEPNCAEGGCPFIVPGGPRSPDPPLPEENTWRGLPEYDPPGFGRVRSSRSGIRNPSDMYCELRGERIESSECNNTCEYYDENQVCRYGEDSQSNAKEEFSE
jgi:hypothetical protein